ncbi:MAG TPA: DUF2283 domain-containing protein [Phycisphaerae bacterium]|nr:DUF2283 domain-containing protein [Phycisphaerae bacterium]
MKIIYDRDVDAITIMFRETTVTTEEVDEGIFFDFDGEHRLAGIEILDASKRLGGEDAVTRASLLGILPQPQP